MPPTPHPKKTIFLFGLSIFIHVAIMVFWLIFKVHINTIFSMSIVAYVFLAIFAFIHFRKKKLLIEASQLILFIAISVFYIIIPFLLWAVPKIQFIGTTTLYDWVMFLIIYFPIWPLYIGLRENIEFIHTYINAWIIILLVIFMFGVGLKLRPSQLTSIGGRPELAQGGVVLNYLIDEGKEIVRNFWDKVQGGVTDFQNRTGINYYTSQIDQDSKETPVGLYLENVRLLDETAYVDYPVIVYADIRGKSFLEEIFVHPSCYIDNVGRGEEDPRVLSILGNEHNTISCTFYDLTAGSYFARVGAVFDFETWAYVTYTFVDLESKRALELQGKNVNSELDIPRLPYSVQTNGPVMLGMASMVDQPIGIDTHYNTREPILGVTIDNLWSSGEINNVEEFRIMVPDDFELVKCDRWKRISDSEKVPSETGDGYAIYSFKKEEIGDPRLSYQSVTCRLHINDPRALLSNSQKVQRTFVAQVKYRYSLEKGVRFIVRE